MRFVPRGPGRVSGPYLEPGDSVALATRHGVAVGGWCLITKDLWAISMVVPADVAPVSCWVAKDSQGRIQWWSDVTWFPSLYAGATAILPLHIEPSAKRVDAPSPRRPRIEQISPPGLDGVIAALEAEQAALHPKPQPGPRPGPR